MLPSLLKATPKATASTLARWIAGRSLRQMLADIARAERDASREELDEARGGRKKNLHELRAAAEADIILPAPPALKDEQLELWRDCTRHLAPLGTFLFDERRAAAATRDFWTALERTYEDHLRTIREYKKGTAA
jgi:regulator of protease activity HflC (stomatin/prohibitin superfamily)